MNGEHTPGHWGWSEGAPGDSEYPPDFPCVGPEDTDEVVCWVETQTHSESTWKANAALIAAAPDLLEACETIEKLGASRYRDLGIDKMVQKAIAKAKGAQ